MDLTATPIEDILDSAAPTASQMTLWLNGHVLTAARLVSWNRSAGLLVCRGGNGFTDEDLHYIRASNIGALTLRVPAPRAESDRLGVEIRDALRHAAGYPVSLAIRPDCFALFPAELQTWLKNIVEAVTLLEIHREALQAQIDQILLRQGAETAVLGGSTLILEAKPDAIPTPDQLRAAILALL